MSNSPASVSEPPADRLGPALAAVRRRLSLLRWLVPLGMFLLVLVYELGAGPWLDAQGELVWHRGMDIVFYGLLGPALTAVALWLLGRWIEERETSELQSLALARAREQAQAGRQLTDDTLQTLFAASTLLSALETHAAAMPPGTLERMLSTHHELDRAIGRLHRRLT
ncbi:MAG: hypothetical protein IT317_03760 [Anaerolineales bacterium]|nr:hypothetical protein [Anaerolineales bacterium]